MGQVEQLAGVPHAQALSLQAFCCLVDALTPPLQLTLELRPRLAGVCDQVLKDVGELDVFVDFQVLREAPEFEDLANSAASLAQGASIRMSLWLTSDVHEPVAVPVTAISQGDGLLAASFC